MARDVTWTVPVEVAGLKDITDISAGYSHMLALSQAGVGIDHSLFLDTDGRVWAMGGNEFGQLGVDDVTESSNPIQVPGLPRIRAIAAGGRYSLALDTNDQVWSWGFNGQGQLGDGQVAWRTQPQLVSGLTRVKEITAGFNHALALNRDNDIMAWGSDDKGQLGDGLPKQGQPHPVRTNTPSNVISISTGNRYSLALDGKGISFSWGANSNGQLGYSSSGPEVYTPQPIPFP